MHIMLMSHCSNMHFSSDLNISSSSRDQTPNSCELPINYRPNLSTESLERKLSTTESEDSFIQFCTDDNGDHGSSDSSVFDSDYSEDDLDCGNINSALSKSINDLTDDSLYEKPSTSTDENALTLQCIENEIDCAAPEVDEELEEKSTGILLNYAKKLTNKNKPVKTVRFSSAPPCVKVMRVWAFAARCARAGHWERFVADRDRFKKRIADIEATISWIFKPKHREKIFSKITLLEAEKRAKKNRTVRESGNCSEVSLKTSEVENQVDNSKQLINVEEQLFSMPVDTERMKDLREPENLLQERKEIAEHDNKKTWSDVTNQGIGKKKYESQNGQEDFMRRSKDTSEENNERVLLRADHKDVVGTHVEIKEKKNENRSNCIHKCKDIEENSNRKLFILGNQQIHMVEPETKFEAKKGSSSNATQGINAINEFLVPTHKFNVNFDPGLHFFIGPVAQIPEIDNVDVERLDPKTNMPLQDRRRLKTL